MRTLIAEDDLTSRLMLHGMLKKYGPCDVAVSGERAVSFVQSALESGDLYDLICLDIMMPDMDGLTALKHIRALEERDGRKGAKVLMTTAHKDKSNVLTAFREQCDGYLVKPVSKPKLLEYLQRFELVESS